MRDGLDYGIYTVGDHNFFAGVVAAINALRFFGCRAPIAVIDIGMEPWMPAYLEGFPDVRVLPISPLLGVTRYTDVRSNEEPVMQDWAYKAFAIVHYSLFRTFTYIDGDYLPLCNLQEELEPLINQGKFVSSEDGRNTWGEAHQQAIGVRPGDYLNINSGFFSLDTARYGSVIDEWRNLMTRRKPRALWYGDQGALNAILDKYGVEKTAFPRLTWNQTGINTSLAESGEVVRQRETLVHQPTGQRIMGWHGCGWHKFWHQIGIDHYRGSAEEREAFRRESQNKSPRAAVELFEHFLFLDCFNRPLLRDGFRLR